MNNLSIFIYMADVLPNLSVILGIFSTIFVFLAVLLLAECHYDLAKKCGIGMLICLPIAVLIPSKQSLYMIAASELGQSALESTIGTKVSAIINNKLDEIIGENKK